MEEFRRLIKCASIPFYRSEIPSRLLTSRTNSVAGYVVSA